MFYVPKTLPSQGQFLGGYLQVPADWSNKLHQDRFTPETGLASPLRGAELPEKRAITSKTEVAQF